METKTGAIFVSDLHEEVMGYPLIGGIATVFDVGAMDGEDAVRLSILFPQAEVHAFEGLTDNYEKYLKHIPEIKAHNVVLSDKREERTYYEQAENGIHSLYDRGQKVKEHTVLSKRLDQYMVDHGIPVPDVMKIDVEGAALEVLEGMGRFLKHVKAIHLETEDYPYFKGQPAFHVDVVRFLEPLFVCTVLSKNVVDDNGHQYDTIWINKDYL